MSYGTSLFLRAVRFVSRHITMPVKQIRRVDGSKGNFFVNSEEVMIFVTKCNFRTNAQKRLVGW